MKQYKEPESQELDLESQELDNDDLQNVVGGLSQGAKDGLATAGTVIGLTAAAGAAILYGEKKGGGRGFGLFRR